MKRAVALALCALLCFASFAEDGDSTPRAEYPSGLYSDSCILVEAETGEVLFEKDADSRRYPASTTKIMTLIVSIERKDGREIVTVPASAGEISMDSTRVPVYYGEKMPLRDLWYGLIYNSGNDAANAIAELTSGSVKAFVEDMNTKAEELGLKSTHFTNPHGLHSQQHYTTCRDMAELTRYCLENDLFREITFSTGYTMQPTSKRGELFLDHHYGITDFSTKYYYPYARGIKTGYTSKAGQCFVGAADKDGRELVVVIMHCGFTKPEKWVDAKKLFEYGFQVLEDRED
ncbi:MAG: D-alanyl-D-alanine carboxypeptidase [Clostridiales bacterium]|nr:D-alanyl-D-alanine carboxypeptidase [Clostridiales bacterium]